MPPPSFSPGIMKGVGVENEALTMMAPLVAGLLQYNIKPNTTVTLTLASKEVAYGEVEKESWTSRVKNSTYWSWTFWMESKEERKGRRGDDIAVCISGGGGSDCGKARDGGIRGDGDGRSRDKGDGGVDGVWDLDLVLALISWILDFDFSFWVRNWPVVAILAAKLQKLLMLSSHRRRLLSKMVHLAPDLGFPANFCSRLCNDYPDKFRTVDTSYGRALELVSWDEELAVPLPALADVSLDLIVDRPLKFKHLRLWKGRNVKRCHRGLLIKNSF
ncbi:hypothetical protein Tsubulata_029273 [Turnera subulata]|uniref:PORR domain-containing protein n=1 Tax=Turnera subulata TaxID=218843 RepID=A0A9Q0GNH9_9ROSI|nr:hypothetical protein Tsubulata_029273 [Turnera subulata]